MRPDDVNPEWAEAAARDLARLHDPLRPLGAAVPWQRYEYEARVALAAVLPEAMAEAWVEGRDDGLDDLGATQTAIDYGELTNPYDEGSKS